MRTLAAGLVLLLAACTSTGAPDPGAVGAASGTWSVELSTAPTVLAVGPTQVYTASFGNGVGGSQVSRIDRATGRLEVQRTLAGQPNGMALGPDGRLYVATVRLPDQRAGTGLQVLDGETLQTQRVVGVEGLPLSVAVAEDAVWVGTASGVHRLDDATLGPLVATSTPAYRLVADGDEMVVVGPDRVERLDLVSGTVAASTAVPAGGSVSATGDGRRLWLVYPDAGQTAVLQRYDAASLQPSVTAPSPGRAGAGAAVAEDALWVVDPTSAQVRCADPDTGVVRSARAVPGATGMVAADETAVFVALARGLRMLPAQC